MTGLTVAHSYHICDRSVNNGITKNINFMKFKVATSRGHSTNQPKGGRNSP